MENTIVITRKITLFPQGDKQEVDRVYKYIRDGMEVQSIMMNQCISAMYVLEMKGLSKEEKKNEMKKLNHRYNRVPDSKLGSAYTFDMEKYPTGLPIAGSIPRACKAKFDKSLKDGLKYGKVSLPTFKKTNPMFVHNDYCNLLGSKLKNGKPNNTGFYSDYETMDDLKNALENDDKPLIHLRFANGIVFDVVFGNPHKSKELRSVMYKAFAGEYKICDSSIGFDKRTGKKIILNLALKIPVQKHSLDHSVTVGVDLGLAIPAVCALNNDFYKREFIGSYDEFTRQRVKIQAIRKRITKQLKETKGGHGRTKKLKHLEKLQLHEREFACTYNHNISRKVVQFAVKNNAAYINLEDLSGIGNSEKKEFVLRNWSYYELQKQIEYKAFKEGIEVRYVEPAYTSQICSVCGDLGERKTQATFCCSNPECSSHKMYANGFNADFNGARNIAKRKPKEDK